MLSRNNFGEKKDRFSIRKLAVGAASVMIGAFFVGVSTQTVHADTVANQEQSQATTTSESDSEFKVDHPKASDSKTVTVKKEVLSDGPDTSAGAWGFPKPAEIIHRKRITNDITTTKEKRTDATKVEHLDNKTVRHTDVTTESTTVEKKQVGHTSHNEYKIWVHIATVDYTAGYYNKMRHHTLLRTDSDGNSQSRDELNDGETGNKFLTDWYDVDADPNITKQREMAAVKKTYQAHYSELAKTVYYDGSGDLEKLPFKREQFIQRLEGDNNIKLEDVVKDLPEGAKASFTDNDKSVTVVIDKDLPIDSSKDSTQTDLIIHKKIRTFRPYETKRVLDTTLPAGTEKVVQKGSPLLHEENLLEYLTYINGKKVDADTIIHHNGDVDLMQYKDEIIHYNPKKAETPKTPTQTPSTSENTETPVVPDDTPSEPSTNVTPTPEVKPEKEAETTDNTDNHEDTVAPHAQNVKAEKHEAKSGKAEHVKNVKSVKTASVKATAMQNVTSSHINENTLPQTGAKESGIAVIMGMIASILAIFGLTTDRKKN